MTVRLSCSPQLTITPLLLRPEARECVGGKTSIHGEGGGQGTLNSAGLPHHCRCCSVGERAGGNGGQCQGRGLGKVGEARGEQHPASYLQPTTTTHVTSGCSTRSHQHL